MTVLCGMVPARLVVLKVTLLALPVGRVCEVCAGVVVCVMIDLVVGLICKVGANPYSANLSLQAAPVERHPSALAINSSADRRA